MGITLYNRDTNVIENVKSHADLTVCQRMANSKTVQQKVVSMCIFRGGQNNHPECITLDEIEIIQQNKINGGQDQQAGKLHSPTN